MCIGYIELYANIGRRKSKTEVPRYTLSSGKVGSSKWIPKKWTAPIHNDIIS